MAGMKKDVVAFGAGNKSNADFSQASALDLKETRQMVRLPVVREDMATVKNKLRSSYQMVMLQTGKELRSIGEVKANRPIILHEQLMDWLCEAFDKTGVQFKLRNNMLQEGSLTLFQEYLFNLNIDSPDRKGISPLVFVRNSFVGGSLFDLYFGSFRHICSNGTINTAGEITHVRANSKNWNRLMNNGLAGELEKAFGSYPKVSEFFRQLYDMPFSGKYHELFAPGMLPIGLRKQVLGSLEASNDITVNIETPKKNVKLKSRYLQESDLADIKNTITPTGNLSMWDVYNRFSNYTSTQLSSGGGIMNANRHIDNAFSVITGRKKG